MIRYALGRIGQALVQLLGLSIILFLLLKAVPGDYLSEAQMNPQISKETIAALRVQYGLDQPLPVRYLHWLRSVAAGEFGYSFAYNMPVAGLLWPRLLHTLLLTLPALALSWLIGVPLGMLAAWRRGGWLDHICSAGTSVLLALPDLLLALLVLMIALHTGRFPVGGMNSEAARDQGGWRLIADTIWHMALPVGVLVIGSMPAILRHVRSSMIEVLGTTYIRAAKGHGLSTVRLLLTHALRAAANPLISLFGLSIAGLLSVSLLVEIIVGWPGLGPMVLEATLGRDLFVVIGIAMFSMLLLTIGNFLADILLYAADPRIRVRQ
jgi:peptide/nickel transport system permease protein